MPDSEDASLSSSAMLLFCSASNWNPDPTKLLQYVESGADVLFTCRRTKNTIFHTLVERSRVRAVEVCLSTHNPMNFTLRGSSRMENPLHISCQGFITDEDSVAMMRAMVYRLETHPKDLVDWGQLDDLGRDFLTLAAQYQKLSLLWPLVRHMPFYGDKVEPFSLHYATVWQADWDGMDTEEKRNFDITKSRMICLDTPTAALCKLSLLSNPDPFMVTTCVEQGADVSFRKPAAVCSILHTFILEGSTACLKALLQTPRAIDFTERGIAGRTPIHDICASNTFEKVEEVLDTILDRLDNHSCDKVDWTIKDKLGRDFISIVSEQKLLSIVWPILKRRKVPYFTRRGVLRIAAPVSRADWDRLDAVDRNTLQPEGFF